MAFCARYSRCSTMAGSMAARKAQDGFVRSQIRGIAAAVTTVPEVEAVLQVRNDGRVHARGLEHRRRALDPLTACGVEVSQGDPHQLFDFVLDHHDVGA